MNPLLSPVRGPLPPGKRGSWAFEHLGLLDQFTLELLRFRLQPLLSHQDDAIRAAAWQRLEAVLTNLELIKRGVEIVGPIGAGLRSISFRREGDRMLAVDVGPALEVTNG